eukprot:SRR837773.22719.p2 GENE.SRR837773.22719~~SRR837773.22719.p2  ORF type:complete len:296 (+),score=29.81 SRR837773.22719:61-888(+)
MDRGVGLFPISTPGEGAGERCSICLEELWSRPTEVSRLDCGHGFHRDCFQHHARFIRPICSPVWCPNCRAEVGDGELWRFGLQEILDARRAAAEAPPPPPPPRTPSRAEERRTRRYARRRHLKYCPRCRASIEKNGGCDHMRCRCGHNFNWSEAETVAKCHRLHLAQDYGTVTGFFMGSTCKGCSCVAKTKLALWRPIGVTLGVGASAVGPGASARGPPRSRRQSAWRPRPWRCWRRGCAVVTRNKVGRFSMGCFKLSGGFIAASLSATLIADDD